MIVDDLQMDSVFKTISFRNQFAALIVVPPFAALEQPALGPHLLQACAKQVGYDVQILYANLLWAAEIGHSAYRSLYAQPRELIGERVFAAAAYGVPPLGRHDINDDVRLMRALQHYDPPMTIHQLQEVESKASRWLDDLVNRILRLKFNILGCSTTFEQTAASIAILKRVKSVLPDAITILGGANCEGEMADGILSLNIGVDFVFSGESEIAFPKFLQEIHSSRRPINRVIKGPVYENLDHLPKPNFDNFYQQFRALNSKTNLKEQDAVWLPYESSRGCWWGQKHHCTFCGLNGQTMAFRAKSPDHVLNELKQLLNRHPNRKISMVDNIMPYEYFENLLPFLAQQLPGLEIFYEQKANLSLRQLIRLKQAGVGVVQPGIESLSSSLLNRMEKGVSAKQNLALLRYARSTGLLLNWNILYGIPGDLASEYEEMVSFLPLLCHLQPPSGLNMLTIDRFSPYFDRPSKYELANIQAWQSYRSVLPAGADVMKIAYHFVADYPSESRQSPGLISKLHQHIETWKLKWTEDVPPPVLLVTRGKHKQFVLRDTRRLDGTDKRYQLTYDQASVVLRGSKDGGLAVVTWALEHNLLIYLDRTYVPLATAEPSLLQEFQSTVSV